MADRLDRALEYARSLAADRAARPRRPLEYARRRPRQYGDAPLGETHTLPAGTKLYRRGGTLHGGGPRTEYSLEHDIVVSADQYDSETVEISGWEYDILDGWDEP